MEQTIEILFEDEGCVVINKPAGIMVHSDGRSTETSIADWALRNYPETEKIGEPITLSNGKKVNRPGIVHRLDKETSGALIVVKTPEFFANIKEQFKSREVAKEYRAFVYGSVKSERGTIDRPIGRSKNDFRKRTAQRGVRGDIREAVTVYRVIERDTDVTLVEVRPLTGRTHQIRVHFKAINHPVVADSLYAQGKPPLLGFKRLALHAKSIEFTDCKGKKRRVEAPYPADFQAAMKVLEEKRAIATKNSL